MKQQEYSGARARSPMRCPRFPPAAGTAARSPVPAYRKRRKLEFGGFSPNNDNNNNRRNNQGRQYSHSPKKYQYHQQQQEQQQQQLPESSPSLDEVLKRRREAANNCPPPPAANNNIDPNADIPRLDPEKPEHARRIQQRRRQISMGKNTAGYDEYVKRVPKHKRKKFSMEHPSTPDATLDIPAKRFQGVMNAWRRALHRFDPPDLLENSLLVKEDEVVKELTESAQKLLQCKDNIQAREIADATRRGLQVELGLEEVNEEDEPEHISPSMIDTSVGRWGDSDESDDDELL
mmetsp:Transcript_45106/g.54648  ORF Transcript_45106/g.54648 Transcript_45106/m.54648 type:complete len:291 (-) Transcript_45106:71-943(-)|eukprot:CAMPEP_0172499202 /NCGR_PEP_ID=MMETSP1066-20121228/123771_1 /TAXON_ID=671091 /ORGANISM="Coscinodiscus wailesii, Strain CCMP2513" /LENGTH=290 /DNA_ID=CAMNT_0013272815 /DNA_START=31 /DNA_END=903 /DNA_ORIENTATION=+